MPKLCFQIFIAGKSNRNQLLVRNFLEACEAKLATSFYDHSVIDLTSNPQLAEKHKILALPTILRSSPSPERRVIGNLSADGAVRALNFLVEDLNTTTHDKS